MVGTQEASLADGELAKGVREHLQEYAGWWKGAQDRRSWRNVLSRGRQFFNLSLPRWGSCHVSKRDRKTERERRMTGCTGGCLSQLEVTWGHETSERPVLLHAPSHDFLNAGSLELMAWWWRWFVLSAGRPCCCCTSCSWCDWEAGRQSDLRFGEYFCWWPLPRNLTRWDFVR